MIERLNLHEISWSRSVRIWTRLSVQPAITNKIKKITTGHKLQILRLGPSVLIQGRTLRYVFLNLYLRNVWPDAKINVSPAFHKSDPKCSSSGFYIKGDVFKVAQKVTKYWASFDQNMLPRPVRKPNLVTLLRLRIHRFVATFYFGGSKLQNSLSESLVLSLTELSIWEKRFAVLVPLLLVFRCEDFIVCWLWIGCCVYNR